MKRTEAEVRNGKKMRESTICTHQTNSSEAGEARSYYFLLRVCKKQDPGFPLLFIAPSTSPGYLQHITPSNCVELFLSEGIPRALGRRGSRQPRPVQGHLTYMAAEPQEVKGPTDGQQTMACPVCLRVQWILSQSLHPDFLSVL